VKFAFLFFGVSNFNDTHSSMLEIEHVTAVHNLTCIPKDPAWISARNQLSWFRLFNIFCSPSREMQEHYLKIGHSHIYFHPSQLTVYNQAST